MDVARRRTAYLPGIVKLAESRIRLLPPRRESELSWKATEAPIQGMTERIYRNGQDFVKLPERELSEMIFWVGFRDSKRLISKPQKETSHTASSQNERRPSSSCPSRYLLCTWGGGRAQPRTLPGLKGKITLFGTLAVEANKPSTEIS